MTDSATPNVPSGNGWGIDRGPIQSPAGTVPPNPTLYPANSELVHDGKIANAQVADQIGQWDGYTQLKADGLRTTHAARGHYILNPFNTNRSEQADVVVDEFKTKERPEAIAFFAGRLWYGGVRDDKFIGTLFYSQLLEREAQEGLCYQEADPTGEEINELIATDGGTIRIPEAGHIQRMIPLGDNLIIFTTAGVWAIGGEGGFKATGFFTRKITDIATLSTGSIVEAEAFVYFWSDSGIYRLEPDKITGYLTSTSMSLDSIQKFYNELSAPAKLQVDGTYDHVEKRIYWFYSPNATWDGGNFDNFSFPAPARYTACLVHNLATLGWSPYEFPDSEYGYVAGSVMGGFSTFARTDCPVVAGNDSVDVETEEVIIPQNETTPAQQTLKLVLVDIFRWSINFGEFWKTTFQDFEDIGGFGTSYESYLLTGYEIPPGLTNVAQQHYIFPVFNRTEMTYQTDEEIVVIDDIPTVIGFDVEWNNESKCLIRAKWDWYDSNGQAEWSPQQDAYILNDIYEPTQTGNETYDYDGGQTVVRNKVRLSGNGTALQLEFRNDGDNDFHLLGWQYVAQGTTAS